MTTRERSEFSGMRVLLAILIVVLPFVCALVGGIGMGWRSFIAPHTDFWMEGVALGLVIGVVAGALIGLAMSGMLFVALIIYW